MTWLRVTRPSEATMQAPTITSNMKLLKIETSVTTTSLKTIKVEEDTASQGQFTAMKKIRERKAKYISIVTWATPVATIASPIEAASPRPDRRGPLRSTIRRESGMEP